MKTLRSVLLAGAVCCSVSLVSVGLASAAAVIPITITLDETNLLQSLATPVTEGAVILCEGSVSATGSCGLSDIAVFSTPANLSVVATYNLPTALHLSINNLITAGTPGAALLISDSELLSSDSVSDVIPGTVTTGAKAKTDILSSNGANTPVLFLSETVNENGGEVITYTPTTGQPGFLSGVPLTYVLTSDPAAVPEPTSALLLGSGVLGLPVLRRRFGRTVGGRSS